MFEPFAGACRKSALKGWAPYLSLEDALKLDDVRAALRRGDIEDAARLSRVYTLTPLAV